MARRRNQEQREGLGRAFEKMDSEVAEGVLRNNLRGMEDRKNADKPLDFYNTGPDKEGYLRHFLRQLAKLCHLRGDMIPKAQESLLQKFLLNRRDRHHLQQMSHAHALRSEEALSHDNAKLALLERLEAWRKMPRDLSLLLDVTEAYIEPESFVEERGLKNSRTREKADSARNTETKERELNQRFYRETGAAKQTILLRERSHKQAKQKEQALRKQQEKTARQLFQLSVRQYRRQALNYLKKAVELFVGLEDENSATKGLLSQELSRLQKLQQNYPKVHWQRYTERIRALKGRPSKRWPWGLLVLLLLASLFAVVVYSLSWFYQIQISGAQTPVSGGQERLSEQALLGKSVPVEWSVPPEKDRSFAKVIQKSQRLKLSQHYVYEIQGHIRVKAKASPEVSKLPSRWQRLRPAEPFDLLLTYEYQGQKIKKRVEFSDSSEEPLPPVMEGDTVLFREVFRLPNGLVNGDRLLAEIAKVGKTQESELAGLNDGGFAQRLNSVDMQGNLVPTVGMAFRDKVVRSDGEKVRLLGYDIELQNNSKRSLDQYELRLSWRQADGIHTQENSPLLLQRDYTIVSASGTNLPGLARTIQRLWLEVPEDLNYPVEKLSPQVRILENRFVTE